MLLMLIPASILAAVAVIEWALAWWWGDQP